MIRAASHTVLLVDDERDLRESVRELIEDSGYGVAEAANGLEAREYLERSPDRPCLVLLDLMMPVMNGWDFLAWLGTQAEPLASVPVVVLTAADRDRVEVVAKARRTAAVLPKPFRIDELLATIERYC